MHLEPARTPSPAVALGPHRTLLVALAAWLATPAPALAQTFRDVTAERGIDVVTSLANGGFGDYGGGVAFTDFDDDGDLDLYVVMSEDQPNKLYRYDAPTGTYVDWAEALGCDDAHWGKGVKICDYDNDGDQDIFLANLNGPNRLFQNDGHGNFADATNYAGLTHTGPSHGAAWGDYDRDGFLDLYVVSHAAGVPNLLYHNEGDGTFEEVAAALGVQDPDRAPFECAWFDYDDDGDLDLYVAVDRERGNTLFRNDGTTFTDVSETSGAGVMMNGMGVDTGDFDNDGFLDVFVTNTEEGHVLLHNEGDGTFTEQAALRGVSANLLGWGTSWLDYDNDGDLDLYAVHWWAYPGGEQARNVLYRNDGGNFTDVADETNTGERGPGYGVAVGDVNDDGFVDLFVLNRETPSVLLENTPNGNQWLKVRTRGRVGNRDGIGAKVVARWGEQIRVREVQGGTGYLAHNSLEVELGLRLRTRVSHLEVRWPSGVVDRYQDVPAGQRIDVIEGETVFAPGSFFPRTVTSGLHARPGGALALAVEDADEDGHVDLYVASGDAPSSWMFENDGRGYFRDLAGLVDLDAPAVAAAAAFADYDGDGRRDLYVATRNGAHRLFRSLRPGQYADVAASVGLAAGGAARSASWVDFDADGRLDLLVTYDDQPPHLFQGQEDGTFVDRAAEQGLDALAPGAHGLWFDVEGDGDADLLAATAQGSQMFRNDDALFAEVTLSLPGGAPAVADVDGDGDLDLLLADGDAVLLANDGAGGFETAGAWPLAAPARAAAFFDADHDGDEDLFVATAGADAFFRNAGGTLTDARSALHLPAHGEARALGVADLNGDATLDVVVANDAAGLVLYEGVPTTNHWLNVQLEGVESHREGWGARVALRTGEAWQVREVGNVGSASTPVSARFGLGSATVVDELVVTWPSGQRDAWTDVEADHRLVLREGSSQPLAITFLQAHAIEQGVEVSWEMDADAPVAGFLVYRRQDQKPPQRLTEHPLAAAARRFVDTTVRPRAQYEYQVAALGRDDTEVLSVEVAVRTAPVSLTLRQNVPNPFNPRTRLAFTLPGDGPASLSIFDAAGRRVRTLVDGELRGGHHERLWDGTDDAGRTVSAGQYFYRLVHGAGSMTRRMILLR